ncbi:Uncharacterised protein [Mycobacteroides abscessus subsp. massiliense]|nr:Uncharacterised protein [Mycobacteroides abscessus subsp. massiliense]
MEPAIGEHVQRSLHETGTGVFAPASGASRHEQPSGRDDSEADMDTSMYPTARLW